MCSTRVRATDFGIDKSVFGTGDENVTFHLHEIGEFGGIQLPDGDGVRFLVMRSDEFSHMRDER